MTESDAEADATGLDAPDNGKKKPPPPPYTPEQLDAIIEAGEFLGVPLPPWPPATTELKWVKDERHPFCEAAIDHGASPEQLHAVVTRVGQAIDLPGIKYKYWKAGLTPVHRLGDVAALLRGVRATKPNGELFPAVRSTEMRPVEQALAEKLVRTAREGGDEVLSRDNAQLRRQVEKLLERQADLEEKATAFDLRQQAEAASAAIAAKKKP